MNNSTNLQHEAHFIIDQCHGKPGFVHHASTAISRVLDVSKNNASTLSISQPSEITQGTHDLHQRPFTPPHQNPTLSLFAAAALVCVASNSDKIEDTTLEYFESVIVDVAVVVVGFALLSSRSEVNQSKATLTGSVVVFAVVVVVRCGSVEPVLEFETEDVILPPELVELGIEVSQSRAALMGLGTFVDEETL